MYVMSARNVRTVDVGMRMGGRRRGYPQQRTKKRTGAMPCPDAHSDENSAGEHVHVFPFAAVLLNNFAFSIAA